MATQPAVLQQCFQEAATASKRALELCADHAVAQLQEAESKSMKVAERDELGLAWRELLRLKPQWGERYPANLLQAFKAAATAAASGEGAQPRASAAAPAPSSSRLKLDVLTLVDDTQLSEAIESARLLQQLLPRVEQVLSELDALVSSALGLTNVTPELNPLRPEIFAQTLRTLMLASASDPALVSLWLKHMADPLSRELKGLYERLVEVLSRANVQAAGYRVLQTPASAAKRPGESGFGALNADGTPGAGQPGTGGAGGAGGQGGAGPGRAGGAGGAPGQMLDPQQYADLSNYEIGDQLFQDFLYRGGSNAQQALEPTYYEAVEEELAALRASPESAPASLGDQAPTAEYRALPAVDRPPRFLDVLSQLSSKVWGAYSRAKERTLLRTELKKDATQVGQVLGLEVVHKVVNQVAQDPRLLMPVRESIVALEPSLLRLAMVDPRYFSDEQHPGRRLVETVAQRSFKYNDEFGGEFSEFFDPVARCFNGLNALPVVENAQPFATALTDLETLWSEQDRQGETRRDQVVQTMRQAEERQTQADQIAYDLSLRSDLEQVPGVVLDFLYGPWALVMANARMADGQRQLDPGGFGAVITDLLWSVKLEQTLKEPAKLIAMIPGVLGKLRAGLNSLGQGPKECDTFFGALMKLHEPVLELRRLRSQRDISESQPIPLEIPLPDIPVATPEQRTPKASNQPWLGPKEQSAAGFDEPATSDRAPLTAAPEVLDSSAMPLDILSGAMPLEEGEDVPNAEEILLGLREGSWVDLYSKDQWLRAQLVWASNRGTLFMFVSHGGQPHSMTKRSCERLIRQRHLRPVGTQDVVGQALETLVA